jgi:protease I
MGAAQWLLFSLSNMSRIGYDGWRHLVTHKPSGKTNLDRPQPNQLSEGGCCMAHELSKIRLLMFVEDSYEDLELWYPKLRLTEAGAHVTVAAPEMGRVYRGKHSYPCAADAAIGDMEAADFQGVVIPGGFMPDKLRRDPKVRELVRNFADGGKLVAAICHGGWIPISAGVYRGVRVTGSLGIKDDLVNAGAQWEDASVVVDRHFVSSRKPDDLPDFCRAIITLLSQR